MPPKKTIKPLGTQIDPDRSGLSILENSSKMSVN